MSQKIPKSPVAVRRKQARVLAALGDVTRLALVAALAGGAPLSIAQLTEGQKLTRQAITKHLRVLEEVGIVRGVKSGRESLFEMDPAPILAARDYLDAVSAQWDEVLERLKGFVEE